ncbi:MAG: hypothetical protein M3Z23_06920 [Acidobacteriota bacterium]|nr:hypothetical protein [Acidobacteriota bacterium]
MSAAPIKKTSVVGFLVLPLIACFLVFAKAHAGSCYRSDDERLVRDGYSRLLNDVPDEAVRVFESGVRRDLASPYRWTELGAALHAEGAKDEIGQARDCFNHAVKLGPNVPPIRLRAANFFLQTGAVPESLAEMAAVLKLTAGYDPIVFSYYRRLGLPVTEILKAGIPDARAARSYFVSLLVADDPKALQPVWAWAVARGYVDNPMTAQYTNYWMSRHDPERADQIWKSHFGARSNLLFNGGFEVLPTGAVLDWVIQPSERAEAARDSQNAFAGEYSLRILFHDGGDKEYAGVSQLAVVKPGRYLLRARIRTEGTPGGAGVSLRVYDAENASRLLKNTPPVSGSTPWMAVAIPIHVQTPTRLLNVQIVRAAGKSGKGTAWIDAVELVPVD